MPPADQASWPAARLYLRDLMTMISPKRLSGMTEVSGDFSISGASVNEPRAAHPVMPRRLFIADPGLIGPLGHHLSYSAAVALAARERGIARVVLAGRSFAGTIAGGDLPVHAVF